MHESHRLGLSAIIAVTSLALIAALLGTDLALATSRATVAAAEDPSPAEGPADDREAVEGPDNGDSGEPDPGEAATDDASEPEIPAWGSAVEGLLRFRGNLTHTHYGRGPLPADPAVAWRFPDAPMCITERATRQETNEDGETETVVSERQWCGTGWTGQPVVWERDDGITEVIIGGFDGLVYFLDGDTGAQLRAPFATGFQVKGTGALDPDGYPLYYTGSRDGYFRVLALDREPVTELWRMAPHPQRVWNNDWDGSPAIVDDILYVGGEDSWFRAVKLNRTLDDAGLVTVDPEVLIEIPGFNNELFAAAGDRNVSIENSVAIDIARDRVVFANSAGRLLALRLSALQRGEEEVLADLWLGDDIDASIVIDPHDGALYVAIELQRFLPRASEVGQLVRLDLHNADNPITWSLAVPPQRTGDDGGIWATPALHAGHLYVATHPGELLVVDTSNGAVVFRDELGWHAWSSPVVVTSNGRDELLVATCVDPHLRAYDLTDPAAPVEQWRIGLPGCIESTPAVWNERIWVGSRNGFFYAIR